MVVTMSVSSAGRHLTFGGGKSHHDTIPPNTFRNSCVLIGSAPKLCIVRKSFTVSRLHLLLRQFHQLRAHHNHRHLVNMEASPALRRCASHISHGSRNGRPGTTSTRLISISQHRIWNNRTSSRNFASTSPSHQETSPQSQPNSQSRDAREALDLNTEAPSKPTNRIDLSALSDISPQRPRSARGQLEALFSKPLGASAPREDPYKRTLRRTSPPGTSQFDIGALLDDINLSPTRPRDFSDHNADHKLPLRLRPTLGRTVTVDNVRNMDITRAFRSLEMKCSQNSVKRDANAQRFHVRRGQKRKMVRSVCWRAAFKKGFLEECARIRRMKNQGW